VKERIFDCVTVGAGPAFRGHFSPRHQEFRATHVLDEELKEIFDRAEYLITSEAFSKISATEAICLEIESAQRWA
jgi:hypothetical protein